MDQKFLDGRLMDPVIRSEDALSGAGGPGRTARGSIRRRRRWPRGYPQPARRLGGRSLARSASSEALAGAGSPGPAYAGARESDLRPKGIASEKTLSTGGSPLVQ